MSIVEIKKNNLKNINIKNQVNSTTPRSTIWDHDKKKTIFYLKIGLEKKDLS